MRYSQADQDLFKKYLKVQFNVALSKPIGNGKFEFSKIVTSGIECTSEQVTKIFNDQGFILICLDVTKDLYFYQNYETLDFAVI